MHARPLGLVPCLVLAACAGDAPSGPSFRLAVAPLSLPGIGYACYDIAVVGSDGPVVALGDRAHTFLDGDDATLCSWQYGSGAGGDLGYVAPCDAGASDGSATNTVTLWFDGLYADPDGDHDPDEDTAIGAWRDPCPDGCSLPVECHANADSRVDFNFTVMREANQGFFDFAVTFDDVFCSAKLDCQDALLIDPATGKRGPTAVLGFACTSGQTAAGAPQETHLYLDDVRIECTNPAHTYYFDATAGPGQVGGQGKGIFETAFYRGHEDLPGLDKCFWNAAFGLDVETAGDAPVLEGDCWLRARGTASQAALVGGHTPPGTKYPVVTWDVQLTDQGGALLCQNHPLDGTPDGVATGYSDFAGESFTCGMACGSGAIDCAGKVQCSGDVPSIPGPVVLTQAPGQVTLTFQGASYDFAIAREATVLDCCADSCCTEEVSK